MALVVLEVLVALLVALVVLVALVACFADCLRGRDLAPCRVCAHGRASAGVRRRRAVCVVVSVFTLSRVAAELWTCGKRYAKAGPR